MSDWFTQNAPAQTSSSGGGDWFSKNAPAAPSQRPATSGSMALDFMQAGGAELIKTALGAYQLLRKIPGADKVLPAVSPDVQQYAEPPKTVAAKIGGLFTQLGEFAIPAGEVAGLTKGAGLAVRALAQGAAAGGTQLIRTGGDVPSAADAAALGAAGPVAGAALGAAAPVAGRILRASPNVAASALGIINPRLGNIARVGIAAAKAAAAGAEEAAPAAVDPLLDNLAQGYGAKDFASLGTTEQATVRNLAARMTGGQAAATPTAAPAYVPRPPEYYGVKPAEAPPPQPPPSAPAPTPASAAPSVTSIQPNGGPLRPPVATVPIPETPAQPALPQKEPWQMTQEEYLDSYEARTRPEITKEVNRKVGELQAGVERMKADIARDPGDPANGSKQAWIADTQKTIQEQTARLTAPLTNPREMWSPEQIQWHHVGHALSQSKAVPPEALASYPELAPKASAAPTAKVQPIRPAPPAEAEDIDFQQRYGEQEQPEVAKFLGHEQPAPPQPKPASGATAAKSARYADAIAAWAKDMGMSPKDIADQWGTTTPEVRGQILLQLKQKGYLGANETIPRTSAQGIVDALKAKAATIKPPKGFSMAEHGVKY